MKKIYVVLLVSLFFMLAGCGRKCDFRSAIFPYGNVTIDFQLSENKKDVEWAIYSFLEGTKGVKTDENGNRIIVVHSGSDFTVKINQGHQVWIGRDGKISKINNPLSADDLIKLKNLLQKIEVWRSPPVLKDWYGFRNSVLESVRTGKLPGDITFKN